MDQKIKHFVIIRFRYNNEFLPIRTRFLNEVCLHSLFNQSNKNFQIVITGRADAPVPIQINSINKLREYHDDDDFVITTRLDSDDVALPNFIAEIQKHFVPKPKTVLDPYGYAYDVRVDTFTRFVQPRTTAFLSFIDRGKDSQTCNAYPHPQMGVHFPVIHIKKYCRIACISSNSSSSSRLPLGRFTQGAEVDRTPYLYYINKTKELDKILRKV